MDIKSCIKKIDRYLSKTDGQPLIIDVQNTSDLSAIVMHYKVGDNNIICASDYCNTDELPHVDAIFNKISNEDNPVFLTELSSFLKLSGENELRKIIKVFLSMSTKGHVVIITYQCKKFLSYNDPRIDRRIAIVDGEKKETPKIILTNSKALLPQKAIFYDGIQNFASIVENSNNNEVYIISSKHKKNFPNTLYRLSSLDKAYEAILHKDSMTSQLSEKMGTDAQWRYALDLFKLKNSWLDIIDDKFGSHKTLEHIIPSYDSLTEDDQWLYFIALKLCGSKNNNYLNMVLSKVFSTKEFTQQLCRYILNIDVDDKNYWQLYNERKVILNQISGCKNELCNYCDLVFGKNIDTIYYLTDVTQKECETIFKYLDQYGEKIERKKLIDILSKVYPALYEYMQPYQFKNTLLNEYFQEYKFQKVINKLLPSFVEIVEQQAKKRDYNSILSPRSSVIEKLDKKNSQLYFIDAMGVEYLGFILSECANMNLDVHITVCRSELPSVTSRNKEFLNAFSDSSYPIISIKDIDDIKHHGKDNYDYYKHSKLPIHLIKELEIIQKVLKKINTDLTSQNKLEKVFIISDHGASRLAVLYDNENIWEMSEKGEHSGRCCLKSDVDRQPDCATDADDFWSLANYDRFKGGRKSNVEVHGGATLEEICVPVIELTRRSESAEIYLMPTNSIDIDDTKIPEIEVSFRKKAALKIYSTTPISNIVVNNNSYEVIEIGNKYYSIEMYDIKKAGTYNADIYSGDNKIASKQFIVKKEGQHEKKLL